MKMRTYKLVKIMVLQILNRYGWESCEEHAIAVFAEIIIKQMKNIAKGAKRLTEMTDRRETNIFDVIHALRMDGTSLRKVEEHITECRKAPLTTPTLKILTQSTQDKVFIEEAVPQVGNLVFSFPKKKMVLEVPSNFRKEDINIAKNRKDMILNVKDITIPMAPSVIKEGSKDLTEIELKKIKSKQKRKLEIAYCDLYQAVENDEKEEKEQQIEKGQASSIINAQPAGNVIYNKSKREMNQSNPFNLQPKKIHTLKLEDVSENQFL